MNHIPQPARCHDPGLRRGPGGGGLRQPPGQRAGPPGRVPCGHRAGGRSRDGRDRAGHGKPLFVPGAAPRALSPPRAFRPVAPRSSSSISRSPASTRSWTRPFSVRHTRGRAGSSRCARRGRRRRTGHPCPRRSRLGAGGPRAGRNGGSRGRWGRYDPRTPGEDCGRQGGL